MSNYDNQYDPLDTNTSWSLAEKYIGKKTTILEVGPGDGGFAGAMIIRKNCRVDAIEPDKGDAALAAKKIKNVINDNLENVIDTLQSNKYDHVIFLDVLEHIKDPVEVLKSIKRVLKKGGSVIFSIPNMAHMSVRLMLLSGSFDYGKTGLLDWTHLHFYTKSEITRIFSEAGYTLGKLQGVIEDIEDKVLDSELNAVGIDNPRPLISLFRKNNGMVYQFVGEAKPSRILKISLPKCSPNIDDIRKGYYQLENDRLKAIIIDKEKIIADLQHKN